jgi:EAL and modified HD-GYP domain-containing signal transduction protein
VHDVLVARQPIYDRSLHVVAYELLLQRGDGATAELGLNLVGGQLAYIPVSRAFLLEGFARALPADRVMLKVPRELELDRAALNELDALIGEGYRLVVEGPRLLDAATVIAVDITSDERHSVPPGDAVLLAQNVGDHDALEFCRSHGFDLLQGYFFCTPREIPGRPVQVNLLNRVKLAATLHSPDVELEQIEQVITRDVALSYNLLRFINSAFFSLPRRVDSIRDALVLLGAENVRRWATLMAIADADSKPRELVVTGLVRARLCELLACAYAHDDPDAFFTAGLFSVVDALTDTSMIELLGSIPLSQELIAALLNHEGAKGRILHSAIAYERGLFSELADLPPTHPPLAELYGQAVAWATASGEML